MSRVQNPRAECGRVVSRVRASAPPRSCRAALILSVCVAVLAPATLAAEELPPRFREAVAAFLAGNFKECQIAFSGAAAEAPRAGLAARAAYGAACCAAVRNDIDGGYEALGLALENGFHDLERALVDPRLETLRADARWFRFVALTGERQQAHQKMLDPDLLRLYLEHQEERGGLAGAGSGAKPAAGATANAFLEHAAARRQQAWVLVEKGRAKRADDAFHAASLLVESDRPAEVERAAALARQALASDPDLLVARPLVATAVDRGRMFAGKPQQFGTQLIEEDGIWKVYDVDPTVTDSERAEWGLPPLAEAQARVAELNRSPGAPQAPVPKPSAPRPRS